MKLRILAKRDQSKQRGSNDDKKKSWKHAASKKEVNALKAMMKRNAEKFKKRLDDQNEEESDQ